MRDQTKSKIAFTCLKLVVVWGFFGILLTEIVMEYGFGIRADVSDRRIQAGALLAALLSLACYAVILGWRRAVVVNHQDVGLGVSEQDFFRARAGWFVWGAIALTVTVSVLIGIDKAKESKLLDEKAAASAAPNEVTFAPCKAAGMIGYQMASKRDQGVPKEEMLKRYQPNDVMDLRAWGLMVDMVYGHPERNPDAIERAFTSHC